MPIPKPKDNETEQDYISRCMGDSVMNEEYPDKDHRAGVCYTAWRNRNKQDTSGLEYKTVKLQLKADKPGHFSAVIATLNVKDHGDDVTLPGAFPDGKELIMSAYQHGSWNGELPVGKGTIHEVGNEVVVEGEFNLASATGKEHYETVKFLGGMQEYSYGFRPIEYEFGKFEDSEVRFLKKVDPFEFSPVLKGEGIGTRTRDIKSDSGQTYAEQAKTALAAVDALVVRTKSLADLRRKDGRSLSDTHREQLTTLSTSLAGISQEIKTLLETSEPSDAGKQALLSLLKTQSKLMEVI